MIPEFFAAIAGYEEWLLFLFSAMMVAIFWPRKDEE